MSDILTQSVENLLLEMILYYEKAVRKLLCSQYSANLYLKGKRKVRTLRSLVWPFLSDCKQIRERLSDRKELQIQSDEEDLDRNSLDSDPENLERNNPTESSQSFVTFCIDLQGNLNLRPQKHVKILEDILSLLILSENPQISDDMGEGHNFSCRRCSAEFSLTTEKPLCSNSFASLKQASTGPNYPEFNFFEDSSRPIILIETLENTLREFYQEHSISRILAKAQIPDNPNQATISEVDLPGLLHLFFADLNH